MWLLLLFAEEEEEEEEVVAPNGAEVVPPREPFMGEWANASVTHRAAKGNDKTERSEVTTT